MHLRRISTALGILGLACALAACGSGTGPQGLNLRADSFNGGALSAFSGADGSDTSARALARELTSGRNYDFTPAGFSLSSGPISSTGQLGSAFSSASGTMNVVGDNVTVVLVPVPTNANVTDVSMEGTFSLSDAQRSILDPGSSFTVDWDIALSSFGVPLSLSAQQVLTGANFQ